MLAIAKSLLCGKLRFTGLQKLSRFFVMISLSKKKKAIKKLIIIIICVSAATTGQQIMVERSVGSLFVVLAIF